MTEQEYKFKILKIDNEAASKKHYVAKEYAKSNNSVKIGDIIEDHIGFMKVEGYQVFYGLHSLPQMAYRGVELTKKLVPAKRQSGRFIYQQNLI